MCLVCEEDAAQRPNKDAECQQYCSFCRGIVDWTKAKEVLRHMGAREETSEERSAHQETESCSQGQEVDEDIRRSQLKIGRYIKVQSY